VFEKPGPQATFIHAGSVHAPDRELALLIARDVFGRRPTRTAMWIAPAAAICSRTAEEMAAEQQIEPSDSGQAVEFQVFAKTRQNGVCVHQGSVLANGPQAALAKALAAFPDVIALVWWLIPDEALIKSDPQQENMLYGSSPGKDFRHERHYPVRTMMREIMARSQKSNKSQDDA
jgi:ring-1,2-phenylacetyl-CoA epoxidase subunit PaaB